MKYLTLQSTLLPFFPPQCKPPHQQRGKFCTVNTEFCVLLYKSIYGLLQRTATQSSKQATLSLPVQCPYGADSNCKNFNPKNCKCSKCECGYTLVGGKCQKVSSIRACNVAMFSSQQQVLAAGMECH